MAVVFGLRYSLGSIPIFRHASKLRTAWIRWGKFSAPFSKRCPASSGLQFPPFLVMNAFLGRKKYDSFLGREGLHLRAWLPSNWKAFIAAIEYHYSIPESVKRSGDPWLIGVLEGLVEAYCGERGFMGTHRYKVYGIHKIASKTGRTETNGLSGAPDSNAKPIDVEPHEMRGTFEECRYRSRILGRSFVDADPNRSIAMVTLNLHDTSFTWGECAKVAAALGLAEYLDYPVTLTTPWQRFARQLGYVRHGSVPQLTVKDLALEVHDMLRASSNTVLQVLATTEWPVRRTLGDLLQAAVLDTDQHIWDLAFDLTGAFSWLSDLIPVEVPRTYSISNYPKELLPSAIDLTVSWAEYKLCSTFAGNNDEMLETGEHILIGVSRPLNFQLPIDRAVTCAYFAGGSGIAPFRSFWQARLSSHTNTGGRDILYLGVQSRDKFCYEQELRKYVGTGPMEVYITFSRDSRGLAYDRGSRDLIEKKMPPRYIDALIMEQTATVSELVMSRKQGGLGGYFYVCGSAAAIYNHCSSSMEAADIILNKAFAERRFMLDVFMTPKSLPCNLPTIPLSQLARETGRRPGGRMWIAVHGSVYDVTDVAPMHPDGTIIIQSNAGVDCSTTFDNLAHTNNPELTPKPDFYGNPELADLYNLWAAYLRTSTETLVAHRFEMYEIAGASDVGTSQEYLRGAENVWRRENMLNIGLGVRMFYDYQSRLLQGGFSALFGAKLQELILKLSFPLANAVASGTDTRLPDVLGIIARAKTSPDAVATSQEVALIGQFVCESSISYAPNSVKLDIELLEDIREEACHGMDALGSIAAMADTDDNHRLTVAATILMQTLERIARRLEVFYSKVSRLQIRDGTFFVLTQKAVLGATPAYVPAANHNNGVDFDNVMDHVQASIRGSPKVSLAPQTLNAMHLARTSLPPAETSAMATHENNTARRAISTFIDANMRSIRRLSKMPPMPLTFEQLQRQFESSNRIGRPPTPPSKHRWHRHGHGQRYPLSADPAPGPGCGDDGYDGKVECQVEGKLGAAPFPRGVPQLQCEVAAAWY
ncbi:hypothetical protein N657DRAFT_666638 [Parathielavia appendiculata]|uniref:NADPH--hemoprotein reductase n=1 Tax=Parathielavia appendiculata TaxID=2587402 RepID=A0AAN6TRP0_9PEZI|nr:hypothetical protein N657DRAFT_666638 [Parathielavia appendiculata]